jgi:hypothetical protein
MFLDELGKIVEARRCGHTNMSVSVAVRRVLLSGVVEEAMLGLRMRRAHEHKVEGGNDAPMAKVKKQKPTMEPIYPTRGRIHMLRVMRNAW